MRRRLGLARQQAEAVAAEERRLGLARPQAEAAAAEEEEAAAAEVRQWWTPPQHCRQLHWRPAQLLVQQRHR